MNSSRYVNAEIDIPPHDPPSGAIVCRLEGELVAASAAQTREAMTSLLSEDQVVLDLSGTWFIDSAGLGALIGGVRRIREHGGRVVVSSCRPGVERLLRMVGFDRVVPVVHNLDQARAVLDATPLRSIRIDAGGGSATPRGR
ncbi:MAG: STAS domain-containing protein [Actinobacteria bacterium]|nr:MAG: STAS domain-containing protein [Actinomycetota bacterium]